MRNLELILGTILALDENLEVLTGREGVKADDRKLVGTLDLVIVLRVGEPEREKTLLLAVGLVDTGERTGDDGAGTEETGLKSGVLARRTLSVVPVADNNPWDVVVTVVGTDLGDGTELASDLVDDRVSLAGVGVDGTDQAVF